MRKSLIYIAALTLITACNKTESPVPTQESGIITAQIEQETATRTYMDTYNNIRWSEGDQVIAFMKSSYGHKYQLISSFIGKTYADFSLVSSGSGNLSAGTEWDHNIVYYPYSDVIEATKSGTNYTLDVLLPSKQTYAAESFGNGLMAMVAVSKDNNITFKNVLGGIKFQLKGTQKVVSITLQGKNNEKLSGAATVTAYTDDETKPVIIMSQAASTSVTLSCGSGVQLNENTSTEFIITLPPVLFNKGFTVMVTDDAGKTYTLETDKANTVLRSSLLTMPAFKLGNSPSDEDADDALIIPVVTVSLSSTSLKFYEGDSYQLTATLKPKDATDKIVVWSSDMPSVATVDQTGLVTGISAGTANISASAGGKVAKCIVTVSSRVVATADYVDEYGVNHGKGTAIGMAVWAPVNCGYHKTDYQWGKLYQWGRKYGQGYSGYLCDKEGESVEYISDATVPTIEEGGVSIITGSNNHNSNVFFTSVAEYDYDWLYPQDDMLWNSSLEPKPIKTGYDPCPDGWRIPTFAELNELLNNHSFWTSERGQCGYWFSGPTAYSETIPQVFLSAAGYRSSAGEAISRGYDGGYWSSGANGSGACYLYIAGHGVVLSVDHRASGNSVRCVQE